MTQESTQPAEEPQVEEPKTVIGPDGEPMEVPKNLRLGYERFRYPINHLRLIWILRKDAWLCVEDVELYRQVHGEGGVVEAGQKLAEEYGVKFREPGQLG